MIELTIVNTRKAIVAEQLQPKRKTGFLEVLLNTVYSQYNEHFFLFPRVRYTEGLPISYCEFTGHVSTRARNNPTSFLN